MSRENSHIERILVCVTGLSPQVVTETLYVLAVKHDWMPSRIRLITTAEGAKRARLSLLSEDPGWLHRLGHDYQLPPIAFSAQDILTLEDVQGSPLHDIRTPQDNERAADFIVEQVRRLTSNPESELHVSIAGGRKTMGFYLGYALSLFGRPRDRLSHVLVSAPYESCWDFFYPTPYSRIIQTGDNNLADSREAMVTLAEIPFVSLRHGMTDDLLAGRVSFAGAVEAVNRSLSPPELVIDLRTKRLLAAGQLMELPPASLALLSLFARRRVNQQDPVGAPIKDVPDARWASLFLDEYRQIKGDMADIALTEQALRKGMDGSYFSSCKSKLHRELKRVLGPSAKEYMIDDGDIRPRKYSLTIPSGAISYQAVDDGETP